MLGHIKTVIFMIGIGIMAATYMSIFSGFGINYKHDAQGLMDTAGLIADVEAKFNPDKKENTTKDVTSIVRRYIPKGTKKDELLKAFKAVGFHVSDLPARADYQVAVTAPLPMTGTKCGYSLLMQFDFYPNSTRVDRIDGQAVSACPEVY